MRLHVVGGSPLTNLTFTMDLMLLNPYFHAKKSQRIHGFVQAEAFNVGIVDSGASRFWHLLEVVKALEGHVLRLRRGLDELDQGVEGVADPGHDDRPTLHAAMAVDAFFERRELQDFLDGELA